MPSIRIIKTCSGKETIADALLNTVLPLVSREEAEKAVRSMNQKQESVGGFVVRGSDVRKILGIEPSPPCDFGSDDYIRFARNCCEYIPD